MVGVLVQVYSVDLDNLGLTRLPAPVQIGDLVALEQGEFRVYDVVEIPDGAIGAMIKVGPSGSGSRRTEEGERSGRASSQ